jgi:cytochrome c oxidase cbb3-type subunit 3
MESYRNRIRALRVGFTVLLIAAAHSTAQAQSKTATRPGQKGSVVATPDAIRESKLDAASVDRGAKLFSIKCGGCHGNSAKGTDLGPNLIYSMVLLLDDRGEAIAPVLRNGRPDQGMPKPDLTESEISDLVNWLHAQVYAADHRVTYAWQNVVTGDPHEGETYFNGPGKCSGCHSVTGDLAGIGKKYDPFSLQLRWVNPGPVTVPGPPGAAALQAARGTQNVTVSLPSGETYSGALVHISDFDVSLRDASGDLRSFARQGSLPKVVVSDPLKAHKDMLRQYTDADIHNITAYLVTFK